MNDMIDFIDPQVKTADSEQAKKELLGAMCSVAGNTKLSRDSLMEWAGFVNRSVMNEPLDDEQLSRLLDYALTHVHWTPDDKNWRWIWWDSDKQILRAKKAGMLESLLPPMFDHFSLQFRDNTRFSKLEVSRENGEWRPLHDDIIAAICHEVNVTMVSGLGVSALKGKELENAHGANRQKWTLDAVESINWSKTVIRSVCASIAQENPVDPYKAILMEAVGDDGGNCAGCGLRTTDGAVTCPSCGTAINRGWDGKARIDSMFADIFAVKESDRWIATLASRNLMLGMVRRTLFPGAKHDECVVLIGDEDIGKSTFCRAILLDPAYIREGFKWDCSEKELVEQARGMVLVEASEMDGMSWKVDGSVKTLLSQTESYLRLSYRRDAESYKFQHIIIGTSNTEEILPHTHKAGNRRFIPLEVKRNDKFVTEHLTPEYVKQLWCEAYNRVMKGELALIQNDDKERMLGHLQRYTAPTTGDEAVYEYLDQRRGYWVSDREVARDLSDKLRNHSPKAIRQIIKNTGLVVSKKRSHRHWEYQIKGGAPTTDAKVVPLRDDDQRYLQEQGDKF